jgi:hypothetical protein
MADLEFWMFDGGLVKQMVDFEFWMVDFGMVGWRRVAPESWGRSAIRPYLLNESSAGIPRR